MGSKFWLSSLGAGMGKMQKACLHYWYMESSGLCFFFQTVTKCVLTWAGFSVLGHLPCIMTLWCSLFCPVGESLFLTKCLNRAALFSKDRGDWEPALDRSICISCEGEKAPHLGTVLCTSAKEHRISGDPQRTKSVSHPTRRAGVVAQYTGTQGLRSGLSLSC